jgi:hypothetical protein
MDMVTIEWTIKKGYGASAVPAVGQVRWHLPLILGDDTALYGKPVPGAWLALDGAGHGSIEIPDPRAEDINPRYWAPLVEVDTDAWQASPYAVVIPEDEAGPFELQFLSPIITDLATGVVQLRGPKGDTGAQGLPGAPGAPGAPGTPGTNGSNGSDGADGQDGAPGEDYSVARRFGCEALAVAPANLTFIGMTSQRLYGFRMYVPQGKLLSSVRVPVKAAGAGAGALRFAVYQADGTQLGVTADVAAQFSGAVAETWQTASLVTPAVTTGEYVWVAGLSTLDTGPQLAYVDVPGFAEQAWVLNTSGVRNAVYVDGVAALPATFTPLSMNPYLDGVWGVV